MSKKLDCITDSLGRVITLIMTIIINLVMSGISIFIVYKSIEEMNIIYLIFSIITLLCSVYLILVSININFFNKEERYY